MKAVSISSYGGPEVLQIKEYPIPRITSNQVLVKVKAAGINRPDIFQRKGNYAPPEGVTVDVPGLEVAGYIEEIGSNVKDFRIADHVMALLPGGGYAEYVAVDSGSCLLIPDNISMEEAAGMPETLFTVWHNVFQRGRLKWGEKILIHGGTGGIGLTAIQLAQKMGAIVYTTVGSEIKKNFIHENFNGCIAINYHTEDFEVVLKDVGIEVILDTIGGDYFNKNINVLAEDGRLVQINAMQGAKVNLNLLRLMQKRLYITGSTLRGRSLAFKAELAEEIKKYVIPLIQKGYYKTYIERVFPYNEAAQAHSLMESRDFIGKIILTF